MDRLVSCNSFRVEYQTPCSQGKWADTIWNSHYRTNSEQWSLTNGFRFKTKLDFFCSRFVRMKKRWWCFWMMQALSNFIVHSFFENNEYSQHGSWAGLNIAQEQIVISSIYRNLVTNRMDQTGNLMFICLKKLKL